LGTYPPRECGIATFTQDLYSYCVKFLGEDFNYKVAAFNINAHNTYKYPKEVAFKIDQEDKDEHIELAKTINEDKNISGVILQHEYGIYGGSSGANILYFMRKCKKPLLVTFHTVLPHPKAQMKKVTRKIVRYATIIVVLTENSKKIIEELYPEAIGKIYVIPHGIHETKFTVQEKYKEKLLLNGRVVLSTFGLLSRGKGIEYVIKSLPEVIKSHPTLLYLVLGETHPVIRRREGEKYRKELYKLIKNLGLQKYVKFYDQYLSLTDLFEFLKATDIYISTSTNPNQAVSGTLSYALGTGRPVVSTEFAQSKEMVTTDVGRLVPIMDSGMFSYALLDLLSDSQKLKEMSKTAYKKTRSMLWANVANEYVNLIRRAEVPELNLHHLYKMTDDFGLFQFANYTKPNRKYGYTLDDNARALILCSWLIKEKYTKKLDKHINIYLNFIKTCQQEDGSFINYINYKEKKPTEQNNMESLEEAQSRALWALSEIINNKFLPMKLKNKARKIFLLTFKNGPEPEFIRAKAFSIKAFSIAQRAMPLHKDELIKRITKYSDDLLKSVKENSYKSWVWFEDGLHYNNGILPESLIIAGRVTKNNLYTEAGVNTLKFLIRKTFSSKIYRPIGNSKWYKNSQKRSEFDQQPEDPASMILALATAYKNTHYEMYKNLAMKCFSWFLGNNILDLPVYDSDSGGSFDALHPDRVNLNEGAESLLSFQLSRFAIKKLNRENSSN
jgi:glycosyltransferase involved in cell wall biosynthesis